VIELAKARATSNGLRAFEINPVSSSVKAIARYGDLCFIALETRQQVFYHGFDSPATFQKSTRPGPLRAVLFFRVQCRNWTRIACELLA
jgi:hypothetical protein